MRKAGGVYYTPAYIVDYIVKQTVGKQIENKSPTQLAGGKRTRQYVSWTSLAEAAPFYWVHTSIFLTTTA